MGWDFKREEQKFEQVSVGKHRVRIKSVEVKQSKNGNDMLEIQLEVSGCNSLLYHYITFLNDRPEITNRMLTQFFDSFKDIREGDFKFANWIGRVGAVMVAPDKNDPDRTRISYFIAADKQNDIPAWKEPNSVTAAATTPTAEVSESDLPF